MIMKLNPDNQFTMTIDGPPTMTEDDWQKVYAKQRRERLADAVHDYLDDNDTTILEFYNDLRDIITEMNTFHKTYADKAEGALLLVHGKPRAEDVDPPEEAWNG